MKPSAAPDGQSRADRNCVCTTFAIVVVCAFSLMVLGYDDTWGIAGRPTWVTQARTYPLVNAGADAMVQLIERNEATRSDRNASIRTIER